MCIRKVAIVALISSGIFFPVQATEFKTANNSRYTNLCMTALAGDRAEIHNTIKSSGYSTKYIVNKVQCNGENLLSFVENNGRNSSSMLKMLDRTKTSISITDLASVN